MPEKATTVLRGLCEADVTKWTFALNGQSLDSIFRRALGMENIEEDYQRVLLRVYIELEPVETSLLLNGEPLPLATEKKPVNKYSKENREVLK